MDDTTESESAAVEHLPTSTCWEYLQAARVGRLAVVNVDGSPDIFPVNHLAHEGSVFIRTARDAKLLHIAHHPLVAFEVDGEEDGAYWSVVIRGRAERVTQEDLLRDSGVRQLESWSPTAKFFAIRVVANSVSGRRFPTRAGRRDPLVAFEGEALAPPPEPEHHLRGERPDHIPHLVPRTDAHPVVPEP